MKVTIQSSFGKQADRQRLAWTLMVLLGTAIIVGEAAAIGAALTGNLDKNLFPFLLPVLVYIGLYFCLKAAFDPFRQRLDAGPLWQQQFPTRRAQEIQRFLRTVGEALEYHTSDWGKFRPADDLAALKHRWSGGDGMELVELAMQLEREYSLSLPEDFLSTDKTLGDLLEYLTRPGADESPPPDNSQRESQP